MSHRATRDVVVIGAGPYGLATTAHMRARGIDVHLIGREMEFWARQMPLGMLLRSGRTSSSISDPTGALSLDAYEAATGRDLGERVRLEDFVEYGRWFQVRVAPDLDRRRVRAARRDGDGFRVLFEDGDDVGCHRLVIATGLEPFAHRPPQLASLTAPLVRHSSELRELDAFAGVRTAVLGGGQSAIELGALLHEAGSEVEIITRAPQIRWLGRSHWLHQRSRTVQRILYAPTDVGPAGLSWVVATPDLFRRLPPRLGEPIAYRCIRPAASGWLADRTAGVIFTTGRSVSSAAPSNGGVKLALDDGTTRKVDRLVLATGYRVRLDRYSLLAQDLLAAVRVVDGAPRLRAGFESSVPGLHFVGAFAAPTFGPVMRFVSGTPFTGRALTARVAGASAPSYRSAQPAPGYT